MTKRTGFKPRNIKPENVHIGDHIQVKYHVGDMIVTRHGIVDRREHYNNMTYWYTKDGYELFLRDGSMGSYILYGEYETLIPATLLLTYRTTSQPTLGEW